MAGDQGECPDLRCCRCGPGLFSPCLPFPSQFSSARADNPYLCFQTNGIILGLEYVLLGALVGVQAFNKTMGHYDNATQAYAVAAWTLSLWAGLFGLMYVIRGMVL